MLYLSQTVLRIALLSFLAVLLLWLLSVYESLYTYHFQMLSLWVVLGGLLFTSCMFSGLDRLSGPLLWSNSLHLGQFLWYPFSGQWLWRSLHKTFILLSISMYCTWRLVMLSSWIYGQSQPLASVTNLQASQDIVYAVDKMPCSYCTSETWAFVNILCLLLSAL